MMNYGNNNNNNDNNEMDFNFYVNYFFLVLNIIIEIFEFDYLVFYI